MASRRIAAVTKVELTDRQRYWLDHIQAAEGSGEPLKRYAKRKRLSVNSLYEAKRRLRKAGALSSATPSDRREPTSSRFVPVSRVAASGPSAPLRVRLSSGVQLEWAEAPRGDALRDLVEALS